MAIIDYAQPCGAAARPVPARQFQDLRGAEPADQPIVVDVHLEPRAHQAGRNRIEHAADRDGARARDRDRGAAEVRGLEPRQRPQGLELQLHRGAAARVPGPHELGEEGLVASQVGEVAAAAQGQRLAQAGLQVPVRRLDAAVLVRGTPVVAGRLQAVVRAERLVAGRGVVVPAEVPVGRRQPVGAMGPGHAAQLPQRFLQALAQGREALPTLDRLDVLPAGEGQPEVVQQMRKGHAGDRDLKADGIGEVRQRLLARRMFLAKDQLPVRPLGGPPLRDPPLQGAQQPVGVALRMPALQLLQHGRRAQVRHLAQQRHDLLRPDADQRIRAGTPAWTTAPLAREERIRLQPPRRALAEPRPRRCDSLPVASSPPLHVPPHLAVRDSQPRHQLLPAIVGRG